MRLKLFIFWLKSIPFWLDSFVLTKTQIHELWAKFYAFYICQMSNEQATSQAVCCFRSLSLISINLFFIWCRLVVAQRNYCEMNDTDFKKKIVP